MRVALIDIDDRYPPIAERRPSDRGLAGARDGPGPARADCRRARAARNLAGSGRTARSGSSRARASRHAPRRGGHAARRPPDWSTTRSRRSPRGIGLLTRRRCTIRPWSDVLLILIVILILAVIWRGPRPSPRSARPSAGGSRRPRSRRARRRRRSRRGVGRLPRPRTPATTDRPEPRRDPDDLDALTHRPGPGPHRTTIEIDGVAVETLADLPPRRDRLLFVGLNPSPVSVTAGHYHQGRLGQTFWRRLMTARVIPSGPTSRPPTTRSWPPATGSPT